MGSRTEGPFTSDDIRHRLPVIGLYGSSSSFTTVPLIMFGIGFRPVLEHTPDASAAARLAGRSICKGVSGAYQMRKTTPASIRKPWSDPSL